MILGGAILLLLCALVVIVGIILAMMGWFRKKDIEQRNLR
jgi:uncharacterized membrane protein